MTTGQVTVGPPATPQYQGTVTSLAGSQLTLALAGPGNQQVTVGLHLTIGAGGAVSGTMTVAGSGG